MYAIVDIETTGGRASTGGITEIAVLLYDGLSVSKIYSTLVNPEMPIPPFITRLTGISDETVKDAPRFWDIAADLRELFDGRTFVAHNVSFDYHFIRNQFHKIGLPFDMPKLCTVQMSRKIIPGLPSYSLGNICAGLGIDIKERHRALGDAEATAELFHLLLNQKQKRHKTKMDHPVQKK